MKFNFLKWMSIVLVYVKFGFFRNKLYLEVYIRSRKLIISGKRGIGNWKVFLLWNRDLYINICI